MVIITICRAQNLVRVLWLFLMSTTRKHVYYSSGEHTLVVKRIALNIMGMGVLGVDFITNFWFWILGPHKVVLRAYYSQFCSEITLVDLRETYIVLKIKPRFVTCMKFVAFLGVTSLFIISPFTNGMNFYL